MKICLLRVVEFNNQKIIHPRDIIPSFELLNIASLLKEKNHPVKLFDNEAMQLDQNKYLQKILEDEYDIYVVHFQPIVSANIEKIIKRIKKRSKDSIVVVFGPTIEYQTRNFLIKSKADFGVLGEAEMTVFELIKFFVSRKDSAKVIPNKIQGLTYIYQGKLIINEERPFIDPDTLPYLAHELIQDRKYKVVSKNINPKGKIKWGFILSSRGCPFSCLFCSPSIRNSFGKKYRFQTPKRTVDEIEYLVNRFGINAVSFEDDIFTLNHSRVGAICKEIIRRKIRITWTAATRLDCLNLKILRLMKKAGCAGLSLGVESGSDRILKLISKGETTKDIENGINLLHKTGIAPTINLIVGHPTETIEELYQTLVITKKLKPVFVHLHYLTPYPGTEIFNRYQNNLTNFKDFTHWRTHSFNISATETKVLQKMLKRIYFSYYINFAYIITYLKYRWSYWIFDPVFEISFLTRSLAYMLLGQK